MIVYNSDMLPWFIILVIQSTTIEPYTTIHYSYIELVMLPLISVIYSYIAISMGIPGS